MSAAALVVTLVRHGEVEGFAHAFIGERDPPLSAAGMGSEPQAEGALGLRTGAALALAWAVLVPLFWWAIERFYAGPQARRAVEASLGAIKRHCEGTA